MQLIGKPDASMTDMEDAAYDISELLALDSTLLRADMSMSRTAPAALRDAAAMTPRQLSVVEAQEALSRELLQAASVHDALIQQYLRMSGAVPQDDSGRHPVSGVLRSDAAPEPKLTHGGT